MSEYDYRIKPEDLENTEIEWDMLSQKQLLKLSQVVETLKQSEEEEHLIKAKNYFNYAILPILQDFGEITSSLLIVNENDKSQLFEVSLKNSKGFDITESFKIVKNLFIVANYIGINFENNEVVLSFVFDYKEFYK